MAKKKVTKKAPKKTSAASKGKLKKKTVAQAKDKTRKTAARTKSSSVAKKSWVKLPKIMDDEPLTSPQKDSCKALHENVNAALATFNESLINTMTSCGPSLKACGCSGGGSSNQKIDLIVLIDTSSSMNGDANNISAAVEAAISLAKQNCSPDLVPIYLGVNGTIGASPTSVFTTSHIDHIESLHGTVPLASDTNPYNTTSGGETSEWGANAIEDLSQYHNWREGACRAIFYISDTGLNGDNSPTAAENTVVANAIVGANNNEVSVFAHYIANATPINANYAALCGNTGGALYQNPAASVDEYVNILSEVICNSCGVNECSSIQIPKIEPCISIKWGASNCDGIESSDDEVMSLTVCNCYDNITFNNFVISMLQVVDENGDPVPMLPNGTPSVKIHPIGTYCFGDIGPCSCVSREFVIITEGAKEGKYKVLVSGICFDVVLSSAQDSACFEFEICKD